MTSRQSRSTPSSSSSSSPHSSKLSKFLAKQSRDRSKSMTDPIAAASTASIASSSSSNYTSVSSPPLSQYSSRKSGKFGGGNVNNNPREDKPSSPQPDLDSEQEDSFDETPVIIEPADMPRLRNRSERPLSMMSDMHAYTSTSSTRISDLPTRLSGWLSHTFTNSSTDLSLPSILSQSNFTSQASPKTKNSALLTAAKHGKGHLDRAMRFLLDSDSIPNKSPEPIWLLGVQHSGYEPPPTPSRRPSVESRRSPSFRSTTSSSATVLPDPSLSQSSSSSKNPANNWPPVFYADFTSRIWLTYRNQFAPIRDSTLSALELDMACCEQQQPVSSSPRPKKWHWPGGGEKGWTSDAGWGCMLRTGQSLLANTLLHLHLGREWRRPPQPVHTNDYATYVQIITWFLDSPLPQAPFSVHRMALAGKDLGKDVGQWFGPSTAAGAIKTLVHAFPEAGLGVSVATDGVIYQSDVYAASNVHIGSPRRHMRAAWGGRAVLVLIGIRLGIDGVNPIYYETIKALFTFPQSVGIAGGRPSSSYYFMGSQADNLFYLDPHHARTTVPIRPAPPHDFKREMTPDSGRPRTSHHRAPTSPSSVRTGSSTFSYHAPLSPSPLQHQLSASSNASGSSGSHPPRWATASMSIPVGGSELDPRELSTESASELDPVAEHYVTQYSASELRTFHCDRVRKIPLSGLDPSMLLGFLCKDEADWIDLRKRVNELMQKHKTIFTIQDEPPSWPSDSDEFMGLESISEPDIDLDFDGDGGEREERPENEDQFFDTRSASHSPMIKGQSSEVDTEEDPIGPITPGPNSMFEVDEPDKSKEHVEDFEEISAEDEDDDDDDWVDPSLPTPLAQSVQRPYAPPLEKTTSTSSTSSAGSAGKGKSKKSVGRKSKKTAVPLMKVPVKAEANFPFPRSLEESVHDGRRSSEAEPYERRMNNARARDGGRTESGGVKAILTEDMR
ncbi:cysteine protease required for autophagy [Suillus paluster]|uniref:cysteine protease required for autophagy n=1 Tax=Suillus paluster TaxID=48578 RepID=UPI001B870FA5|nr:cysteine protease required for autophagy [Suillus paluster]KAG1736670.1 cysteine protease required for autophagy [Suillus paluster]